MTWAISQPKGRTLIPFALGLLTGAAQLTPLFLKIAPLLGIPLFLWTQGRFFTNKRDAIFALGFFKWGYYTIALYWIMIALSIDMTHFWWMVPFALLGLPFILALFSVCLSWLIPWYKTSNTLIRLLLFACVWTLSEGLHSYLFTGLPWGLLAYIWAPLLPMCQSVTFLSIYGLSFFTILLAGLPLLCFTKTRYHLPFSLALMAFFCGLYLWGTYRLHTHPSQRSTHYVRLVQPNIEQEIKWDDAHQKENLRTLMRLSTRPSKHPLQAIIWPESALTYTLSPSLLRLLDQYLPKGTLLITGALRYQTKAPSYEVWNSLYVIGEGTVKATYDKTHLVPFGEYVPLRAEIEAIVGETSFKKVAHGLKDITFGKERQSIHTEQLPAFYPLICYEIIFPYPNLKHFDVPPQWILNLTNDAWYGDTAGPYQHLDIARFRAIETGLPVIRVANTGISAVIDRYGRLLESLPFNTQGVIDAALPIG